MQDPDLPIAELGLANRTQNALLGAGIQTAGDALALLKKGDIAALEIKGFGAKSLQDLKDRLREQGFTLPGEGTRLPPPPVTPPPPPPVLVEPEAEPLAPVAEAAPPPFIAPTPAEAPVFVAPPPEDAPPPPPERSGATLGCFIAAGVALLLLAFLFLPPVSLAGRLGVIGYKTLNAENSSVSQPDGITLRVNPDTFDGRLRVRLTSVPALKLMAGEAGRALHDAVEVWPADLSAKSPLYQIDVRGKTTQPVTIDIAMPTGAEPWELLDLYTWTGKEWRWIGGELHTEVANQEFLRVVVTELPKNIIVVQSASVQQTISADVEPGESPAGAAAGALGEFNPAGLLLVADGGLYGDPNSLPAPVAGAPFVILPSLRNWSAEAPVNRGALLDVLNLPDVQSAHIANVLNLCAGRGFAGVEIDYRGLEAADRDAYAAFIRALADALHAQGLRLHVVVGAPTPAGGGWDTGGYDWARIGEAADGVKIPFPADPAAYAEGGQAHQLLQWVVSQVNRRKLYMQVSSLSAEQSGAGIRFISWEQAMAPFGDILPLADVSQVKQGDNVTFTLAGQLRSVTPLDAAGTYRFDYDAGGEARTIWLGTSANLSYKLAWARRYHLGGVAVVDLLDAGNGPGVAEAVAAYRASAPPPPLQPMTVVWTVTSPGAAVDQRSAAFTDPGYIWNAAVAPGVYTVQASVAGAVRGGVQVTVIEPPPAVITPTEPLTPTAAVTDTLPNVTPPAATAETCLDAAYVADVSVPDNTQFDNGKEFDKTWRLKNTGSCPWPEDAVLAFVDGAKMDAQDSVAVGVVQPGQTVDVTVKMKAPAEAGRYTGWWQMKSAQGTFGGKVTVVIVAGQAPAQPVVAPVSGGGFDLGAHVLGLDYANKMHYAGMTWVKVQARYGDDSGFIAQAHAAGFKVLIGALGSSNMVTQPGFEQNFAAWVAGLASAGADAIEIWNEPNIEREWQLGSIDPTAYTRLLCASYNAIKKANPNTWVVSAALSPTWHNPPYHWGDDVFLRGMANAGAAGCMDYVGAHYNSGIVPPSQRSGSPQGDHYSWYFWPMVDLYYNSFGGARKVVFTEMGYLSGEGYCQLPGNFLWAANTTAAQQAQWLAEAVSQAASSGKVRLIIVWNVGFTRYDCGPGNGDPQAGYSIIRPGGGCPACDTLHGVMGTR